MKKIEAAYIAGLMDGEGCFYIERFKTAASPIGFQYRVIATITMCDKRTIEYVCKVTGKNYRTRKIKSGRIAYTIDFRSGIAGELLKAIQPFLQNKKEQAKICLLFNKSVAPGRGRTYTQNHAKICEAMRLKLQRLKR